MFVQFENSSMQKVVTVFTDSQDPEIYPNQDDIAFDDARFQAYYDAQIPFIQDLLSGMAH